MKHFFILLLVTLLSCNKTENKNVEKRSDPPQQNIVLMIDKSLSMYSIDFEPNRSEAILKVVRNVVSAKKENQAFSIVVFAGDSYLICPITRDKQKLLTSIDKITKDITPFKPLKAGTNFSHALLNALHSVEGQEGEKSIFLFSDGTKTKDSYPISLPVNEAIKNRITINSIIITPKDIAVSPVFMDLKGNLKYEKVKPIKIDTVKAKEIPTKTGGFLKIFYTQKDLEQFDLKKAMFLPNNQSPIKTNPAKVNSEKLNLVYLEIKKKNDSINSLYQ